MGTVYEAVDERVSATVALKEANLVTDDSSHREFEREARLLANLHHQALPKVMDYFIEGDGEFLVMEYIAGYDLAELLKRRGAPFHVNLVLRWADELLKVLEYLHGHNPPILHRDIKPANLKLTQQEELFLLDFGLAKGSAGKMTTLLTSRSVRGYTPVYAPVEQIMGQGTDARSDLYSLGATLYHLLTNVLPTDAPTRDEHVEDEKPDPLLPIHRLNPKVPPGVAAVIHQAMAIRRKNRPESAAEMRRALHSAQEEAKRAGVGSESQQAIEEKQTVDNSSNRFAAPTVRIEGEQKTGAVQPRITQRSETPFSSSGEGANAAVTEQDVLNDERPASQPSISARLKPLADKSALSQRKNRVILIGAILMAVVLIVTVGLIVRRGRQPANAKTVAQSEMKSFSENLNGVALEMVAIPGGTYVMGSPTFESGRTDAEGPQHGVTLKDFYMGKYEVTQAQWKAVMGNNPSAFQSDDRPVDHVSWKDAEEFCKKLSQMAGREYRLPSEAEWEYACRAGTTDAYAGDLDSMGWYSNNSGLQYIKADEIMKRDQSEYIKRIAENQNQTHPVGRKQPNGFGLYDMYGNVAEWCEDALHDSYNGAPTDGTAWLSGGDQGFRIKRGGSWASTSKTSRSASRAAANLDDRSSTSGFRVVAKPPI